MFYYYQKNREKGEKGKKGDQRVTLNEERQIIHLFKIIKIINKFKIFKNH